METETSHCSSLSLLPPPQIPVEPYIGCFATLISNWNIRYDGVVSHLNFHKWIIRLQNVRCYGTEGRGNNGFQIMPFNEVYEYMDFNGHYLKTVIVKPKGANTHQKVPLICNENLEKQQATTDSEASSLIGSVHIASNPYTQPQFPGSNYYDPRSMPYGLLYQAPIYNASNPQYGSLNQAPIYNASNPQYVPYGSLNQAPIYNASNPQCVPYGSLNQAPIYNASNSQYVPCGSLNQAPIGNASNPQYVPCGSLNQAPIGKALESELMSTQTNPSQSFFSNNLWSFPPVPFSIQPLDGAVAFETAKNFKKYEIWGPSENKNQRDETVSNPLEPIERTYHPYDPIERPLDYLKEIHNYLQRNALLPGYNMTCL